MGDRQHAPGVTWDLTDLYAAVGSPAIRRDLDEALRRAKDFASRYRGTIHVAGGPAPEWVADGVREIEAIHELADRSEIYADLLHAADARVAEHGALVSMTQERGSEILNELIFFDLEWLALEDSVAQRIIESPACDAYRHHLVTARRYRPHMLSEAEERILEETANTGSRAFCRLFDEILSAMQFEVDVDGEARRMNESGVMALLHDGRRDVRRNAAAAVTRKLSEHSLLLGSIFNVSAQDHALTDRLRHYPDALAARHLENEIDATTVEALITACEENADVVAEYYRLKRRLLGLDVLYDYDRYAPLPTSGHARTGRGDPPVLTWEEGRELVLAAYGDFSPRMREVATLFFENRWIDAEVREGKRGGAFSASTLPSVHPYVLLSYLGQPRDVMTLAHELGHGVHQYLSRGQGYLQGDTPLTMAETASVFGELLVFERMRRQQQDPRAALSLLCEFIEEAFGTVFRQAAFTRFEQRTHQLRRSDGELPLQRICDIWQEVNAAMYGDAIVLTEDYRWWWSYIPHFIHSPFYCYAYSFGELLVLALYELYREEGETFVPRYLDLLAAGGSAAPTALLGKLGIDIRQPAFWSRGLGTLRRLVGEATELAASIDGTCGTSASPR